MIDFLFNAAMVLIMSSVVIILVLITRKIFAGRLNLSILSFLWLIVLARLVIPITITSPIALSDLYKADKEAENQVVQTDLLDEYTADDYTPETEEIPVTYFMPTNNINNSDTEGTANADVEISAEPNAKIDLAGILRSGAFIASMIFLWMAGAWIAFLRNAQAIYAFNSRVSLLNELRNNPAQMSVNKGMAALGIKRQVKVYECDFVSVPVTCGLICPKILLPLDFTEAMDSNKMYLILLHELSHIKNHDILKNYLWLSVRIVYWFNPLVALAYKRYLEDIEYISDDTVIKRLDGQSPAEYIQSLLDAVKLSSNFIKVPLALSFCRSKSTLRKRVEIMMKPRKKSKLIGAATIVLCIAMVIGCFTTACVKRDDISTDNSIEILDSQEEGTQTNESDEQELRPSFLNIDGNDYDMSLKQNLIGSQDAAIAVAQSINISNAESFTYQSSFERGVMLVHDVWADGDTFTEYQIYDFNGEIRMLQTSALCTKEVGEELSTYELEQKVIDFAQIIYPGTTLNLTDCVKDTRTWQTDGVEYQSKDYIVTGKLYDSVDNSIRTFASKVRLDGCVRYVEAEYNGLDYLGFSNNIRNKVLSYAENDDVEIDIFQIEDYYGDKTLHFKLGDGQGTVTLLASDMSLVDYLNITNETDVEYSLTDDEVDLLVKQYADYYFPDNTGVVINEEQVILGDYVGEGTITDSRGEMYFYIQLNGDGKIHKIGIRPNIDTESLTKIDEATALQAAIEALIRDIDFIDINRLEHLSTDVNNDEVLESYYFRLKYTSENPSIYDYSLIAQVKVNSYSGEAYFQHAEYVEGELDLITQDEAIELAKKYIAETYNLDPDKLIYKEFIVMADAVLEFQANFDYEDGKTYGASMLADTGECDGVGWGS